MRLGAIILAVCLALGIVEAGQLLVGTGELAEADPWIAFWRAVPSWLLLAAMSPVAVWTSDRWPVRGETWGGALLRHAAVAVPFALTHLALSMVWGGLRPGALDLGFASGFGWLLSRYLVYDILSYGTLVGVVHAYRYHREVQLRGEETAALLREVEMARLRAVEGKLHPHFIFNTLNAITGLAARGDQRGVAETLEAFSELLHATLDDQDAKVVTLREELELLRSYLDIQKVRFGDRLVVEWDISPATLDAQVPGLLLQPLVENALRHGIGRNRAGGTVVIRAKAVPRGTEIDVSDTGAGSASALEEAPPSGWGIGLDGTRSRLVALFGDDARLELDARPEGGSTSRVFVPAVLSPGHPPSQ